MTSCKFVILTIGSAWCAVQTIVTFAACEVRSGSKTAALVELYTSEGCSSCPPADQRLAHLRETIDPSAEVVALALHVPYWDYIGWKDPYAQRLFGERQSWLVRSNQRKVVYTPQFFVAGAEVGAWQRTLRDAVKQVNARVAPASIRLGARLVTSDALALDADARTHNGRDSVSLYVAVTENGLVSKVARGENRGATLAHDHVVREWIGPTPLSDGTARIQRRIALPPAWDRTRLEVVAFVQDERRGRVLQAVSAPPCTGD